MKSKIITVVGKFDVEMTYKPSPDDSILLKLADAVNRFFIPYLPREFDPDTGDIMEIVENVISQVQKNNDLDKALLQIFPSTEPFERNEIVANLTLTTLEGRKEVTQKLIFSLIEKELEKKLFESQTVGNGSAPRLQLSLKKKVIEFQSF